MGLKRTSSDGTTASPCTAVLLVAHGSCRQAANNDLRELAKRLAATGNYLIVEPCFLELVQPNLKMVAEDCIARGATRVLIVPYFLSAGLHFERDLVEARAELSRRQPRIVFLLAPPLGPHPLLDQLVYERIRELECADRQIPEKRLSSSDIDTIHPKD
jgi:sirohydrochlorin ferrochelatase